VQAIQNRNRIFLRRLWAATFRRRVPDLIKLALRLGEATIIARRGYDGSNLRPYRNAGNICAWSVDARDKAQGDRIGPDAEERRCRRYRNDNGNLAANQVGGQRRKPIVLASDQRHSIATFRPAS